MSTIFGPVPSRRLGRSLGVDLIPFKTCTFDCVYCELGPTTCQTNERRPYIDIDTIIPELKERLDQFSGELDYITLAGSGEPTLNSDLGELIERTKGLTNIPLALLTNSSLLSDPLVRAALHPLDLILPSLDAITPEIFGKINRPLCGIEIGEIIGGLVKLREEFAGQIWLEILIVKGINDSERELTALKQVVRTIRPDTIHLNTVFRPPAVEGIQPVSEQRLKDLEAFFGPQARAVGRVNIVKKVLTNSRNMSMRILRLLQRRPCTLEEIMQSVLADKENILGHLECLGEKGEVITENFLGKTYYRAKDPQRKTE